MDHLAHFASDWNDVALNFILWSVIAYAIRMIPQPENRWVKWIVNVVQFAFSNLDRVKRTPTTENPEKD